MALEKLVFNGGRTVVEWDTSIQIGELITTYYKGYYELVDIEEREGNSPIFHFVMKFNSKGKKVKSNIRHSCCSGFCRKAIEKLRQSIAKKQKELEDLTKIHYELANKHQGW